MYMTPTEQAMVAYVRPKSGQHVIKFCLHLRQKPILGRHVRKLMLGNRLNHVPLVIQEELFKRAITPNMTYLGGDFGETSASLLLKVVQESGERFDSLELLDICPTTVDTYSNLVLFFKKSLQSLTILLERSLAPFYRDIVNRLEEFENLKLLNFVGKEDVAAQDALLELETVLKKRCHHLNSIQIWLKIEGTEWNNKDFSKRWILQNVDQSLTVRSFMGYVWHPVLLEYLTYKYPNLKDAYIFFQATTITEQAAKRMIDCLRLISDVKIEQLCINNAHEIKNAFSAMKSSTNLVKLRRLSSFEDATNRTCLDISKRKASDKTVFTVEISTNTLLQLLNDTRALMGLSNLHIIYTDDFRPNIDDNEGASTFSKLLAMISVASRVKFFGALIAFPQLPVGNLVTLSLQELEICGAFIEDKVLSFLSQAAPHLKYLTLNTCILDAMCPQHQLINMPCSDLDTLAIVSFIEECIDSSPYPEFEFTSERYGAFESISESIDIEEKQIVSVMVSSLSTKQIQHFILKPSTPAAIVTISQEDYVKYASGCPSIIIKCKSLKVLKLDLGYLAVELNLDADRKIESLDEWIHNHRRHGVFLQQIYPPE
ncbi:hypothetical protein MBANPS3_011555 [Mucor bainieri]